MNDNFAMIFVNLSGMIVLFGSISLWVWIDNRNKTRKRELAHLERMRSIERGVPIEDQAVARNQALGAIGVAVPIVSMCAAGVASIVVPFTKFDMGLRVLLFAIVWIVTGIVSWSAVQGVLFQLKKQPVPLPFREEVLDDDDQTHSDEAIPPIPNDADSPPSGQFSARSPRG
ncbi:MAG: hypothetical protein ACFCD0_11905 [Gemmataceae bacterium]